MRVRLRALAGQLASEACCVGAILRTARLLASCAERPQQQLRCCSGRIGLRQVSGVTCLRTVVRRGCLPPGVALNSLAWRTHQVQHWAQGCGHVKWRAPAAAVASAAGPGGRRASRALLTRNGRRALEITCAEPVWCKLRCTTYGHCFQRVSLPPTGNA